MQHFSFSVFLRCKLRVCSQFIECKNKILRDTEDDIYIFLPTRYASAIWAGSTNAPALFLQSRFGASIARQLSWCLTNSRVHKERKKFDGRYRVTAVGQTLFSSFSSFFHLEGTLGRGPNKIETQREYDELPKIRPDT